MARFPTRESDIIALAHQMIAGFSANPKLFANPPFTAAQLQDSLTLFLADSDAAAAADAHAVQAHAKKDVSLGKLTDGMSSMLRYAETVTTRPEQLGLVGWSGRKAAATLEAPGQCRSLEAVRKGSGLVSLSWREPVDGGKPSGYRVQRRDLPDGKWAIAEIAMSTSITLSDQPMGKSVEYRVCAVNKTGDGEYGNVVEVVL